MMDCAKIRHNYLTGRMGGPPPRAILRSKVAFPKNFYFFYFFYFVFTFVKRF